MLLFICIAFVNKFTLLTEVSSPETNGIRLSKHRLLNSLNSCMLLLVFWAVFWYGFLYTVWNHPTIQFSSICIHVYNNLYTTNSRRTEICLQSRCFIFYGFCFSYSEYTVMHHIALEISQIYLKILLFSSNTSAKDKNI